MTPNPLESGPAPRFPDVSRRAFLRGSALAGLAAAAVPVLAACGGSATADTTTTTELAPGTSPAATTTVSGAVAETTATTEASATTASQGFPAGAQMQVNFTYQAAGGGRVHSPYIAVWIEDPAGNLVQTVSLWYKSDESKYLKDLKRWNSKNNSDALTTGATRIPGAFSVAWNGTGLDGALVADGDYFVCIEAAREDGPYQIIRESIPVSGSLVPTTLTPNGELIAASVELVA